MKYFNILNKVGQVENISKSIIVKSCQKIELESVMEFTSSQIKGNTVIKAVVMPGGFISLKGIIKIKPHINQVNAFLKHSVLLIGKNSSAVSIPQLEIESNDVEASHASTIGQIDLEQLFYLMSRGFSYTNAVKLIIKSFLSN
jgi:Fe-S cluster assembly protein SufD